MRVSSIDHVNIRTPDVAGTARFFNDILGMALMPSPGDPDPGKAVWICDGDGRPVVHLAGPDILYPSETSVQDHEPEGSGRVHHVALRCSGYPAMMERLRDRGLGFEANDVPAVRLRQLFLTEPNGILLELNFYDEG